MANENKKGLGRGLSDLFGGSTYQQSSKSEEKEANVSRETIDPKEYMKNVSRETTNKENEVDPSTSLHSSQDELEGVSRETIEKSTSTSEHLVSTQDDVRAVSEKEINTGEVEPEVIIREEKPVKEQISTNEEIKESDSSNERDLIEINVNDIEPNPDQPRMNFDEQKLQELAHSIQDQGVLQPIVVRKKGDKYQIIAGERRWQASRMAGLDKVPCLLQDVNDEKALELGLIENIQRDDLNPIEEAYTYKRLMDKMNYTQAELAKAVAKGRSTIANAIRLLDLPEEAQEAMFNNQITAGHARAVLSVPSAKGRKKLTDKIISDKLTVRETESLARLLSIDTSSNVKRNTNNIPPAYTAMAKSLKEVLKTQVRVKRTKTGSKLEITFKNEEELRNIYDKLVEE